MLSCHIRTLSQTEYALLDTFLYEAIFIENGALPPPRTITVEPMLQRYIAEFGRVGDLCFVAEMKGNVIGAVWTRLFSADTPGYGTINAAIPELSISILPAFRSNGIGTALLKRILEQLKKEGYSAVSLSTQPQNPAMQLYEKLGFSIYAHKEDGSIIMQKSFI